MFHGFSSLLSFSKGPRYNMHQPSRRPFLERQICHAYTWRRDERFFRGVHLLLPRLYCDEEAYLTFVPHSPYCQTEIACCFYYSLHRCREGAHFPHRRLI